VVAIRLFWLQLAFSRLVQVWEQLGYFGFNSRFRLLLALLCATALFSFGALGVVLVLLVWCLRVCTIVVGLWC
jgi:hypothetical protein